MGRRDVSEKRQLLPPSRLPLSGWQSSGNLSVGEHFRPAGGPPYASLPSIGYISAVERKDVEEGGGGRVGAIKFAIAEGAART